MMSSIKKDSVYSFRHGVLTDAEAINDLMKLAFANYAKKKSNEKKKVINSALKEKIAEIKNDLENNIVLILNDGDQIIASLRLEEISDKRYLLKRFAVSPAYQNQGLGTMLFEKAVIELKILNASYIQLYSSLENNKLVYFYQDLGFNCLEKDSIKGYQRGLWVKTIK